MKTVFALTGAVMMLENVAVKKGLFKIAKVYFQQRINSVSQKIYQGSP